MKLALFWAACALLAVVPMYFVANKVYHDGIVGRGFLCLISFFASATMIDAVLSNDAGKYDPLPTNVGMLCAFSGFLVWHLWRFHRRVLKNKPCPPEQDRRSTPERRFQ